MKTIITTIIAITALLSCTPATKSITNDTLTGTWQHMDNGADSKKEVGINISSVSTITFQTNGNYTNTTTVYLADKPTEVTEEGTYQLQDNTVTFCETNHNNYTHTHIIEQPTPNTIVIHSTGNTSERTYKRIN